MTCRPLATSLDLAYRPTSYFWARDLNIPLTADIKGAERRRLTKAALRAGVVPLPALGGRSLSEASRQSWELQHPSHMGGEYLPDYQGEEVEVARITIASTTQDVTSIYAQRIADGIRMRVVDEYGGETLAGPSSSDVQAPLTLGELYDFFMASWPLLDCLDMNFEHLGYPRDAVQAFVVDASSDFYSQFGRLIRIRIAEWLSEKTGTLR